MTKRIRVENADTSEYKVVVEVWDRFGDPPVDILARTIELQHPCAITPEDLYITSNRYLVVKEK